MRLGKRIPEQDETLVRRFIKRRIEQEQGSSVVSLAANQEGAWTYTMPPGMHAMMESLAKSLNLSVPDAISRILLEWCQRNLSMSIERGRMNRSCQAATINSERYATRTEERLKQMVDHEERKLTALQANLSRVQKLEEAENLPDVIKFMQDEIIKVESNLKNLQETYEGTKIYTQLVKQELSRIPAAGAPNRTA